MKNKAYVILSVMVALVFCFAVPSSLAQATNNLGSFTPSVYKVTFTKFELKKQDGTYVTVYNTPTLVNIASAGGADTIIQTLANQTIPAGVYTAFRVTVSTDMSIAGTRAVGGTNYVTDGSSAAGAPLMKPSPPATLAETSFTVPPAEAASCVVEQALTGSPVTIAAGSNYGTVSVKIDLTNVCTMYVIDGNPVEAASWMEPDAPSVQVTTP